LERAISTWLSAPEGFRFLENLIYGVLRHSSLFVETEFVLLAQAIESLHRLTDSSTVVAPAFFKKVLESLCELISRESGSSPIAKRFLDSIRHADEPAFQNRIESLLFRISAGLSVKLLGDITMFEQTLRQTRNHFASGNLQEVEGLDWGKGAFSVQSKTACLSATIDADKTRVLKRRTYSSLFIANRVSGFDEHTPIFLRRRRLISAISPSPTLLGQPRRSGR
jgi:Apea-like HEPN